MSLSKDEREVLERAQTPSSWN